MKDSSINLNRVAVSVFKLNIIDQPAEFENYLEEFDSEDFNNANNGELF